MQVQYFYDKLDGQGKVLSNVPKREEKSLEMKFFLDTLGWHEIVVSVNNSVSEINQTITVLVQRRVPAVTIETMGAVARNEYTVFVAKEDGECIMIIFRRFYIFSLALLLPCVDAMEITCHVTLTLDTLANHRAAFL